MKDAIALALLAIFSVSPGFGQTEVKTDSQTLQALLVEVRGLHNDVRLSATSQILLAEFEVQQGVVTRAMLKRDNAKQMATQVDETRKMFTTQLKNMDNSTDTLTDAQKKQNDQMEKQMKLQLTNMETQQQDRGNELQDADRALQHEQDALAEIQRQLDAVVKRLQPAASE
jgi:hypothetical protein